MNLRILKNITFACVLVLALGAASSAFADRYDPYAPLPSCSIAITRMSGEGYNKSITLYWTSTNAEQGNLHGYGTVGANGVHVVYYPFKDRYTLTVEGDGGKAVCDTRYTSSTSGHPHYDHVPPHIPQYVYLTQIPYTGFGSGFASLLMFAMLLAFSFAGAYLTIYYAGVNRAAFAREVARAADNQLTAVRRTFRF